MPHSTAYRAPFFDLVVPMLWERGYELRLAHGGTSAEFDLRGDGVQSSWSTRVPARTRETNTQQPWALRSWREAMPDPDLVVVQQAIKNLETYPLLAQRRFGGPRVAMWGHGRSYSTAQGPTAAAFKQWLTRRAEWFFAYTPKGAEHVIERGFPRDRVTVMNNTIDTATLGSDLERLSKKDVDEFRLRNDLVPGRTALFLGGVDENKGISFLLNSATITARRLPGFKLLIAGDGSLSSQCRAAQANGAPIRVLGRVHGQEKALALRAADVLTIPEWIGLVAVDSLVAGVPIVSTIHPSHSPEAEYLTNGKTAVFVDHEASGYAEAVANLLIDTERRAAMTQACIRESEEYSLEKMAHSFIKGALAWDALSRS